MLLMRIKINSQRPEMRIFTAKSNITRENVIFLIVNDRNIIYIYIYIYVCVCVCVCILTTCWKNGIFIILYFLTVYCDTIM